MAIQLYSYVLSLSLFFIHFKFPTKNSLYFVNFISTSIISFFSSISVLIFIPQDDEITTVIYR